MQGHDDIKEKEKKADTKGIGKEKETEKEVEEEEEEATEQDDKERDKKQFYSELRKLLKQHCEGQIEILRQELNASIPVHLELDEIEDELRRFHSSTSFDNSTDLAREFLRCFLTQMCTCLKGRKARTSTETTLAARLIKRYREDLEKKLQSLNEFDVTCGLKISTRKRQNVRKTDVKYPPPYNRTKAMKRFVTLKKFEKELREEYHEYMQSYSS